MLTDAQVRKIKPIDKKKRYSDEKGLYLEVTPSGGRFWRLKYRFNGRESTLTIGSYPEVSLAQARRVRDEARIQLYNNIDPNTAKNQRLDQTDKNKLFKVLAMEWMQDRKDAITEGTYLRDLSVFEKDLFPALGDMPIDQIKGKDVLACAKKN
ncbi:Prophage integrase IntA [Acinetobacter junii]|nr:Prophage integrase IntA [Acinetobacter junii]